MDSADPLSGAHSANRTARTARLPRRLSRGFAAVVMFVGLIIRPSAQTSSPGLIMSSSALLPESIRRETFATIDRTRTTIAKAVSGQGLWIGADGAPTVFPVLALIEPDGPAYGYEQVVERALSEASTRLDAVISKPWTPHDAAEAAYTVSALAMLGRPVPSPAVSNRIARANTGGMSPTQIYFAASARELCGADASQCWEALAHAREHTPTVAGTALCAIGRLMRNPGTSPAPPGDDVLAHVRWLVKKIDLGYHNPDPGRNDPLTPSAALFVADIFSRIPRALCGEESMPPYDWRNHVANRIITRQIYDPDTGLGFWDSGDGDPLSPASIHETAVAVFVLSMLAR